jgi:hypothetical protein
VTVAGHNGPVRANTLPAGICLVRIQANADGVLISLMTNDDVGQRSTAQEHGPWIDSELAIAAVREFLTGWRSRAEAIAKRGE